MTTFCRPQLGGSDIGESKGRGTEGVGVGGAGLAGRLRDSKPQRFHGNQTSRKREQLTLKEVGGELLVKDGPAEYFNCRVVAVGQESLAQDISRCLCAENPPPRMKLPSLTVNSLKFP